MQKNISGKFCGFACSISEEVENVSTNQKPVMRSWVWNYSKKIHFSRNICVNVCSGSEEEVENVKGF
jgi:hypothetical protein